MPKHKPLLMKKLLNLLVSPLEINPLLTITIHMPQRTSKILLVRLTANKNAFLFQIRVTSFALYTVRFGVTRSDQNKVNDYFTLSTNTYVDWFPLHTQRQKLIVLHINLVTILTRIHFQSEKH